MPTLLARSDRQAVREVEKALRERDVAIHPETAVESLTPEADGVSARLSGGRSVRAAKVLVAVGRTPNSDGFGFAENGVRLEKGAVVVDAGRRTSAEGVCAIGDVTGGIQLAHVASYQAEIAVTNALGGDRNNFV